MVSRVFYYIIFIVSRRPKRAVWRGPAAGANLISIVYHRRRRHHDNNIINIINCTLCTLIAARESE